MALAISLCIIPSRLLPICEEEFNIVLFQSLFPPLYLLLHVGRKVAKLPVLLLFLLFWSDRGRSDLLADNDLFFLGVFVLFIVSGRGGRGGGGIFWTPRISAHLVLFLPGGKTIAPGGISGNWKIDVVSYNHLHNIKLFEKRNMECKREKRNIYVLKSKIINSQF